MATLPSFRDTVDQNFLMEPLGGPKDVMYYLGRFPDEIYHKSPDSHLYKFLRTMLGENGVNWVKKNHLEARLLLEDMGIELFDLDRFYGNIFQFGRIIEESFDDDPYGLIDKATWESIKAKNARYRNRALDFISGARAGNTPFGMRLVAKSGLGHDAEVIENYRYLYDIHSDDPLGLPYFGKTTSTEEMIIVPRRELDDTEGSYSVLPIDQYNLKEAVDRIRPQTTIMTLAAARGQRTHVSWAKDYATSEYTEVIRYVTGVPSVKWPTPSISQPNFWIEPQVEKEAPRLANDLQHHYTGFHTVVDITASSQLLNFSTGVSYYATNALATFSEPPMVTSASEQQNGQLGSFINGVYPSEYQNLPGVSQPTVTDQFWASIDQEGEENLMVTLPTLRGVNYVSFDMAKIPVQIDVEYDAYNDDEQLFVPILPGSDYQNVISEQSDGPWASIGLTFSNLKQSMIYTRAVKIRFTRLGNYRGSVKVKNLRIGRNV